MAGRTRHCWKRMSQRGIRAEILELVKKFGASCGDKRVLDCKACRAASAELMKIKRLLDQAAEKGGYVLVNCADVDITAYRYE